MIKGKFMFKCEKNRIQQYLQRLLAVAASVLLMFAGSVSAQVTMETLLDRIQIEDLLVRYYYELSQGNAHEMAEYFTEDALLDVDGTIAVGHDEIAALYTRPEGSEEAEARANRGVGHMLLTNSVIDVDGNNAVAHVLWTGVLNPGVGQAPNLYEQGREDTALVKVNGKWLISKRYISSDSGIPDKYDATYEPRGNPLAD
jgi:hypothetical protein